MDARHSQFDFFIAHAGPDTKAATSLYRLLSKRHRVFLDAEALLAGDAWDEELPKAQRQSRVTVVLVSSYTDRAYYQREEIAQAIDLARSEAGRHHVIPVYLNGQPSPTDIQPGFRRLHYLFVERPNSFRDVALELTKTLQELDRREGRDTVIREAIIAYKSSDGRNRLHTLFPGDSLILGRPPVANIAFDDVRVSRHHARLCLQGDGLSITDQGSANHTLVNGADVPYALLRTHDRVQLGWSGPTIRIVKAPPPDDATERETID